MATSPNYSWPEPDNTDLVKNGALAIRTLGNAIDTTMATMVPKSTVTTKGDLVAATASATVSRLGVGSNGQVLTADSTAATGLAWTTISSSPSFVGVRTFVTGQQSISNGTGTKINWSSETFDTSAFHDNTTNNTRLTVPSGKAGYYEVYAVVVWPDSSGSRQVWLEKNGSTQFAKIIGNQSSGYPTGNYVSSVVNLAVGDYVEVGVYQASGGSLNTQGTSDIGGGMQFGMTYLGA